MYKIFCCLRKNPLLDRQASTMDLSVGNDDFIEGNKISNLGLVT